MSKRAFWILHSGFEWFSWFRLSATSRAGGNLWYSLDGLWVCRNRHGEMALVFQSRRPVVMLVVSTEWYWWEGGAECVTCWQTKENLDWYQQIIMLCVGLPNVGFRISIFATSFEYFTPLLLTNRDGESSLLYLCNSYSSRSQAQIHRERVEREIKHRILGSTSRETPGGRKATCNRNR